MGILYDNLFEFMGILYDNLFEFMGIFYGNRFEFDVRFLGIALHKARTMESGEIETATAKYFGLKRIIYTTQQRVES